MKKTYWYFVFEISNLTTGRIMARGKTVIESDNEFFPKIKAEDYAGSQKPSHVKPSEIAPFITNQVEISEADFKTSKET